MKLVLPIVLILLSLLLTGTMAGINPDDDTPVVECNDSATLVSESPVIGGETGLIAAPKESVASADGLLASVELEELRPADGVTYILTARHQDEQQPVGFFTPLEGDALDGLPFQELLDGYGERQLRLIEVDGSALNASQPLGFASAAPCGN